jgi:hypothetical protein
MKRHPARQLLFAALSSACCLAACQQNLGPQLKALEDKLAAVEAKANTLEQTIARQAVSDIAVHIELQGVGPNADLMIVDPYRKESCQPAKSNCAAEVEWIVDGHLPTGWWIEIKEKPGGTATACFQDMRLEAGHLSEKQTPAVSCRGPNARWAYDVVLRRADGTERRRADPLVVMNWSS